MTSEEGLLRKPSNGTKIKVKNYYETYVDKDELKAMLLENPNISHIANHFNVARATIRKKIEKYGLEVVREIGQEKLQKRLEIQEKKEKYCKLFMQFIGIKTIGKKFHVGPPKVKSALHEYNITILESGKKTKVINHIKNEEFFKPISSYLLEVITGELLGVGCLGLQMKDEKDFLNDLKSEKYYEYVSFLRSLLQSPIRQITSILIENFNNAVEYISSFPTAQFRMHVGIKSKSWIDYQSSLFVNEGYSANVFMRDKKIPTIESDKTTGFDTSSSVQLFELYAIWYPDNKKILPPNLNITPNVLLHWYIGDGSFGPHSFYLSTQNFTKIEVRKLSELLKRDADVISTVHEHKDGFILTMSLKKDNIERFFNFTEKANSTALEIAKQTFPWKFDKNLAYKRYLDSQKNI
jgi:hypothetical protein